MYQGLDQGPGSSGGPRAQLLDDWMAGLAGGGGISITPDVPYMNHTCIYIYIYIYIYI
jgi:hypothetical protein